MRTIGLRERQTRTLRLRRADVDWLLVHHAAQIDVVPALDRGWYRVTPRGWVGVVHTPGCRLVIAPKISLSTLRLLVDPDVKVLDMPGEVAPRFDEWLRDLLAGRLAELMTERAGQGLHRDYLEEQQSGQQLRGRLDVAAQQRETARGGIRLHGIAETRTIDVPVNQIPRAVAERFRPAALIERALRGWEGVTPVMSSLPHLLAGAVPAGYRPLLEWCRLIEEGHGPGAGGAAGVNLLVNLETAFERHLTRGLIEACAGSAVSVGVQTWHHTQPAGFAFHPDLVLSVGGRARVVVDAKWKVLRPAALDAGDVHQVLAYATALGATYAVLVYPGKRNRVWEYELPSGSVRLEIRTLRMSGAVGGCGGSLRRLSSDLRTISEKKVQRT